MEAKSIERIAEELGINFYDLHPFILMREKEARREVVEFLYDEFAYFMDDEFKTLAKIIIDDGDYYGREGSVARWLAQCKKWGIKR